MMSHKTPKKNFGLVEMILTNDNNGINIDLSGFRHKQVEIVMWSYRTKFRVEDRFDFGYCVGNKNGGHTIVIVKAYKNTLLERRLRRITQSILNLVSMRRS